MKHLFILVGLMLGIAVAACAQQPEPVHLSHTAADKSSPIYSDGKCHFQFKAVPGQRYSDKDYIFDPTKDDPSGWAFGIGCHAGASQENIDKLLWFKHTHGKWVWTYGGDPVTPAMHFHAYDLTGKNWTGTGIAYDQTQGQEDRRQQFFNFCLIESHGPQVLCGRTELRSLNQPPSTSTLPKIMAVLRTLVFVNAPASASAAQSVPRTQNTTQQSITKQNKPTNTTYRLGKCDFSMKLNGGMFYSDKNAGGYTRRTPVGFPTLLVNCHSGASQKDIDGLLTARQANGKWIWEGTNQPFIPEQHFKAYKLAGKNWTGTGIAYNDTTGDEATRQRYFYFCLSQTRGAQVLCGRSQVKNLNYPPPTPVLPKILTVLKTIVFVNAPARTAVPTSAASGN